MFGGRISTWDFVIIALAVLILFGGWQKMPDMARSLGKAIKEFKKAIKGVQDDVMSDDETKPVNEQRPDDTNKSV